MKREKKSSVPSFSDYMRCLRTVRRDKKMYPLISNNAQGTPLFNQAALNDTMRQAERMAWSD